jgi:hypothetical protein
MTLPTITESCLLAQLSKFTQKSQSEFATEVITELLEKQPHAMEVAIGLLEPFLKPQPEITEVSLDQAQEILMQASFCVLGVFLKSLEAQAEANEMDEHWG